MAKRKGTFHSFNEDGSAKGRCNSACWDSLKPPDTCKCSCGKAAHGIGRDKAAEVLSRQGYWKYFAGGKDYELHDLPTEQGEFVWTGDEL